MIIMAENRSLMIDGEEYRNTSSAFQHVFGNYFGTARVYHDMGMKFVNENRDTLDNEKYRFIGLLAEIVDAELPETDGVTYGFLNCIMDLSTGDWGDSGLIGQLYKKGEKFIRNFPE
jgi:hypothetical protein